MRTVAEAQYTDHQDPQLEGNPFAEAIPAQLPIADFVKAAAYLPPYDKSQVNLPAPARRLAAKLLQECVVPSRLYWDFYSAFHTMVLNGYRHRNPLQPSTVQWMYDIASNRRQVERTTAESLFCSGLSGVGKSTLLKTVLHFFPQVITHKSYAGQNFQRSQLVYVAVEVPPDASRRALCLSIFDAVDEALETDFGRQYRRGRPSIDDMQHGIQTITASYSLGALIIDEFQHLNIAKSGGQAQVLQFFDTLANTVRVPIVKIGTMAAISMFSGTLRSARRAATGGHIELRPHPADSNDWHNLVRHVWSYQWVKYPPLNDELADYLHQLTQGLPSMLLRLLEITQLEAISRQRERVTKTLLKEVYKKHFGLLSHALSALRRGETGQYEDLMTAAQFYESGSRNRLGEMLRLAQSQGFNAESAKSARDIANDLEIELDLSESQKRSVAKVKEKAKLVEQGS